MIPSYSLCPNLVPEPLSTTGSVAGGMLACSDRSGGHTVYFFYNGTSLQPQAECSSNVSAWLIHGFKWFDVNSTYDAGDFYPSIDVTSIAFTAGGWVGAKRTSESGWVTSKSDLSDLAVTIGTAAPNPVTFVRIYTMLTSGMATMTVAKLVSLESSSALSGRWSNNATDRKSTV